MVGVEYCGIGVWDVMTNEEVVEFIRKRIAEKMKPAEVLVVILIKIECYVVV